MATSPHLSSSRSASRMDTCAVTIPPMHAAHLALCAGIQVFQCTFNTENLAGLMKPRRWAQAPSCKKEGCQYLVHHSNELLERQGINGGGLGKAN